MRGKGLHRLSGELQMMFMEFMGLRRLSVEIQEASMGFHKKNQGVD